MSNHQNQRFYPYPTYDTQQRAALTLKRQIHRVSTDTDNLLNDMYTPRSEETDDGKKLPNVPGAEARVFDPDVVKKKFTNYYNSVEFKNKHGNFREHLDKSTHHKSKKDKKRKHLDTPPTSDDHHYTSRSRRKHKHKKHKKASKYDKYDHEEQSPQETIKRNKYASRGDRNEPPSFGRHELGESLKKVYGNKYSSGGQKLPNSSFISEIAVTQPLKKIKKAEYPKTGIFSLTSSNKTLSESTLSSRASSSFVPFTNKPSTITKATDCIKLASANVPELKTPPVEIKRVLVPFEKSTESRSESRAANLSPEIYNDPLPSFDINKEMPQLSPISIKKLIGAMSLKTQVSHDLEKSSSSSSISSPSEKRPTPIVKIQHCQEINCDRKINTFSIGEIIGMGTYGVVRKGIDIRTNETVALKKLRLGKEVEGFPISSIREIKSLRQLNHPNIVHLREIVVNPESNKGKDGVKLKLAIYMVFEYMMYDLGGLIISKQMNQEWTESRIRSVFVQLMRGVAEIHRNNIMHRDIKCANILVNKMGVVKIGDFGLARKFECLAINPNNEKNATDSDSEEEISTTTLGRPYTNKVVSLWYRPLELLLGAEKYDKYIDIWSCGCILGEFYKKSAIFQGLTEPEQVLNILMTCGTPSVKSYPKIVELEYYDKYIKSEKKIFPRKLREEFLIKLMPLQALDLLDKMLELNPERRISAAKVLECDWLKSANKNLQLIEIPIDEDCHEMSAVNKMVEERNKKAALVKCFYKKNARK